jgi:hypothetical protein
MDGRTVSDAMEGSGAARTPQLGFLAHWTISAGFILGVVVHLHDRRPCGTRRTRPDLTAG